MKLFTRYSHFNDTFKIHAVLEPRLPGPRRRGPYMDGFGRPPDTATHFVQYQSFSGISECLYIFKQRKWNPASHPSQIKTLLVSFNRTLQLSHLNGESIYALAVSGKAAKKTSGFDSCMANAICWCTCRCSSGGWLVFDPRTRVGDFDPFPTLSPAPEVETLRETLKRVTGFLGGLPRGLTAAFGLLGVTLILDLFPVGKIKVSELNSRCYQIECGIFRQSSQEALPNVCRSNSAHTINRVNMAHGWTNIIWPYARFPTTFRHAA